MPVARRAASLRSTAVAVGIAIALSSVAFVPASADDSSEGQDESVSQVINNAVAEAAPETEEIVQPTETVEGQFESEVKTPFGEAHIAIGDEGERTSVSAGEAGEGPMNGLELPDAGQGNEASIAEDGTVLYLAEDGSVDVGVQTLEDGAVRAVTVINDAAAPTVYEYSFDLAEGSKFVPTADGGLHLIDPEGGVAGAILPAWAVDAAGRDVPTRYEVEGNIVKQIVEHTGEGTAYPVSADPKIYYEWWQIFSWSNYSRPRDYPQGQLSIALSGWGRWDVVTAADQFLVTGWNLLKKNYSSYVLTTGMKQQWDCHVLGGFAEWGTFDLEQKRPSKPNWRSRIGTGL